MGRLGDSSQRAGSLGLNSGGTAAAVPRGRAVGGVAEDQKEMRYHFTSTLTSGGSFAVIFLKITDIFASKGYSPIWGLEIT